MRDRLKLGSALVALLILALGVAACGGGSSSETSKGATSPSQSDISGTVTVWDSEFGSVPQATKAAERLDADFERLYPNVTVNRVAQPPEGYEALLRAAFVARETPDVMMLQPGSAGVLSFTKGLEVLNDRLGSDLKENLAGWETVTPGFTAEGDHYGVPLGLQGWVFYYNKKLFAKAGLPTDFQPKTWDEVREAGERLKAAGIQPFTGGNKEGYENGWWFSVGMQTENPEQKTTELAEGKLPLTDEAIAKAFGPEIEMQEAGLYPADRFTTPLVPEGYARFAEGKGAMVLGLWNVLGYWGEFNPKLGEKNVGIFLAPGSPAVGTTSNIVMSMPKAAKNKDAALALMEYTASKKGLETLFDVAGYLPNRTGVGLPADAPSQPRELLEAVRSSETMVAPFVVVPATVAFGTMLTEMNQVLQGRVSLEDAQRSMQETAERSGE